MKKSIKDKLPFAEAFSKILFPFAEVVLHDLAKDQIEAIYNPLSKREVGDSSYFERMDFDLSESMIGPYAKTNWDGSPMKAISITIFNDRGNAEGLMCINIDISYFEKASSLIRSFLENSSQINEKSKELFKEDFYEKINEFVRNYCLNKQISIDALSKEEKKKIILSLEDEGAFKERNAPIYIGRVLGISRATVYNYLKEGSK